MELLTAAEMRAIEQEAMARGDATGLELMERAGFAAAKAALNWRPDLQRGERRLIALCGPGNNGGDGYVVARLLAERGWRVDLFAWGDASRQGPDAAEARRRWEAFGAVQPWEGVPARLEAAGKGGRGAADLIVDALFGTGLTRPMPPEIAGAIQPLTAGRPPAPVFSIDMPSGLCADSGRPLGAAVRADLCVTFHAPKIGHHLLPGPDHVADLRRADIGLGPLRPRAAQGPRAALMREVPAGLDKGAGGGWGHKYDHGHALVLAGGVGRGGAARLAARAALRVGAGLVTLGPPPSALQENAARLDAVMLRPVADAEGLAAALEDPRINALALGMGLGLDRDGGERTRALTLAALGARRATVLDADAVTAFAEAPDALLGALHERCVLTPHRGEFARLFPDIAERWAAPAGEGPAFSKIDAAAEAAARAGCTVLLKGSDTVVASPARGVDVLSPRQMGRLPWLATAGAGDVLAGLIAGLCARGLAPFDAASAAVWLHARAAKTFGPGLIAEDLPDMLPEVFDDLGF